MAMNFTTAGADVVWDIIADGAKWRTSTSGRGFIRNLQILLGRLAPVGTATPLGAVQAVAVDGAWGINTTRALWFAVTTETSRARVLAGWQESQRNRNVTDPLIAAATYLLSQSARPSMTAICLGDGAITPPRVDVAPPASAITTISATAVGAAVSCDSPEAPAPLPGATPGGGTPAPSGDKGPIPGMPDASKGGTPSPGTTPTPGAGTTPAKNKIAIASIDQALTTPIGHRGFPWAPVLIGGGIAAGLLAVVLMMRSPPAASARGKRGASA